MWKTIRPPFRGIKQKFGHGRKRVLTFIDQRPFPSFFIALGILVVLIVLSNLLGNPKPAPVNTKVAPKTVQIYTPGTTPILSVQAQIEKSGVIRITALTSGVVQHIYKKEGDPFFRGQTLVGMSTNYAGGNAPDLQRKLAELSYNNAVDTYQLQKDLIQKQHDVADELNDVSGETDLTNLQQNVTDKQLDIQSKSVDLGRDTAQVQLQLAQVQEGLMFPSAPFAGTVEKVLVKEGQAVSPGQELMVISQNLKDDPVHAIAYVSSDLVNTLSPAAPSTLYLQKDTLKLIPFYITQDAVVGTLYAVYFDIPDKYRDQVTEAGHIRIDLALTGDNSTSSSSLLIPVDAVYQTKDTSYLFVADHGKASVRQVALGPVYGNFVEISRGVQADDHIILDRNVIAGDTITIQ